MVASFVKLPIGWKIGSVLLVVVLLGFLFVTVYLGLRILVGWRSLKNIKDDKDRGSLKIEIIKTGASILGGVFFLLTLLFTYQNLRLTEEKNRADLLMDQERHRTDLFTKAINQLGSNKLEVRLGGIYALERIARDSPKDHWPIMEVLTAYVRENTPWPPEDHEAAKKKRPWAKKRSMVMKPDLKPDSDIQAVLTVLVRRNLTYGKGENQPLNLRETDLRGARLKGEFGARLQGAILERAHLERADLREANLEGAALKYACLDEAELEKAHLQRAKLCFTGLVDAGLFEARLDEADLRHANFNKAHLVKALLEGAKLQGTDFRGVSLWKEQIIRAECWPLARYNANLLAELGFPPEHNERLEKKNLSGYPLEGANLRGANLLDFNLQEANLKGAHMEQAYLAGANLERAILKGTHLQGAELYNANLKGADLTGTKLEGASLWKANLEGAELREANMEGANLGKATGLTQAQIDLAIIDDKTILPDHLQKKGTKKARPQ